VKDDRAERAALGIEDVMNRSLSQLADQIHIPAKTLVVFNSLNWQRDALVETDLFDNPQVMDLTTHETVPFEILAAKEKFLHVRFLAKNLPAVGYKSGQSHLEIQPWNRRVADRIAGLPRGISNVESDS
jgi:alpha-mannosidase